MVCCEVIHPREAIAPPEALSSREVPGSEHKNERGAHWLVWVNFLIFHFSSLAQPNYETLAVHWQLPICRFLSLALSPQSKNTANPQGFICHISHCHGSIHNQRPVYRGYDQHCRSCFVFRCRHNQHHFGLCNPSGESAAQR